METKSNGAIASVDSVLAEENTWKVAVEAVTATRAAFLELQALEIISQCDSYEVVQVEGPLLNPIAAHSEYRGVETSLAWKIRLPPSWLSNKWLLQPQNNLSGDDRIVAEKFNIGTFESFVTLFTSNSNYETALRAACENGLLADVLVWRLEQTFYGFVRR